MPAIGHVQYDEATNSYSGELTTLSLRAKITMTPNPDKSMNDNRPNYRIYAGQNVEIGAGWIKQNKSGEDYVNVKIAAPELPHVIYANLGRAAGQDDDSAYALIWNPPE